MANWNPGDYSAHSSEQQKWARELIGKLNLRGNERVLDIGCGDGKVTAEIAAKLKRGSALGVDSSVEMVRFASQAFPQSQHPNLAFAVGDASSLQFDHEFDIVFSNAALHWIFDHAPVLAGIRRSLRRGGRILLQMGGAGNAAGPLEVVDEMMRSSSWKSHFRDFTFKYGFHDPERYTHWLRSAGLMPRRVELIPKEMTHPGREGLLAWFRTTWIPYIHAIPESHRGPFINEMTDRYLAKFPLQDGLAIVKMVGLEVEADAK